MNITPEQMEMLVEAVSKAIGFYPCKTEEVKNLYRDHVEKILAASLPLHRTMVIEECGKRLEVSDLYQTANSIRTLATQETKP